MIGRNGFRPGPGPTAGRAAAQSSGAPAAARRQKPARFVTLMIWALVVFNIVPSTILDRPTKLAANAVVMPTEGTALSKFLWLSLLGCGIAIALARKTQVKKLLRTMNPYLLGFYLLIAASIFWSIEPGITVKRLVTASTILVDAIALAVASWRPTRFQSVLRPVLTALLLASIVLVMMEPTLAIEQSNALELVGAWHGLTAQKNAFGSLSAIAFLLWLHGYLTKETPNWLAILGAAIAAVCLLNSRSSTSIMATAFAAILMLMMLRSPPGLRRYLPYLIAIFVSALLVYSLAVLNLLPGSGTLLSPITAITGKDLTFSGRTAIWAIMNEHIAQRPLLGSGYGAYWVQKPDSPSMAMLQRLYFYPTEGHNGYLDVIDDLGMVGGFCLFGYLIVFLRQGLRLFKLMRPQGTLYLTLLFIQLIGNLSESRWFNSLDFNFVIMTIATVAMGRTLMDLPQPGQKTATSAARGPSAALPRRPMRP
ncbi:MAG: O-antigen ligase [Gammaproteobacteria bacterium]|nr:O-antigen ligase [Gammaproteobacteria bacterium]